MTTTDVTTTDTAATSHLRAPTRTGDRSSPPPPAPSPRPMSVPARTAALLGPAWDLRASDAEREQVAQVVQVAVGEGRLDLGEADERLAATYAAVLRRDLCWITEDLTPDRVPALDTPTRTSAETSALDRPAERSTGVSVAIMNGVHRRGVWTPGPRHHATALMGGVTLRFRRARLSPAGLAVHAAVAVMGGVTIDLRGAQLAPSGTTVHAAALRGGVEVIVDDDTTVIVEGMGRMGRMGRMGNIIDLAGRPRRPDGPVVRVAGWACWGGITITRNGTRTRCCHDQTPAPEPPWTTWPPRHSRATQPSAPHDPTAPGRRTYTSQRSPPVPGPQAHALHRLDPPNRTADPSDPHQPSESTKSTPQPATSTRHIHPAHPPVADAAAIGGTS